MFFYHTQRTNLDKFIIEKLQKEYTLIVKPSYSFQLAKTIKPLIKILELQASKNEMNFTE